MLRRTFSLCATFVLIAFSSVGCISEPPESSVPYDSGTAVSDTGSDAMDSVDQGAMDAGSDSGEPADVGTDMSMPMPPEFRRSSAGLLLYYRFQDTGNVIVDEGPGGRDVVLPMNAVLSPQGLDLPSSSLLQIPDSETLAADINATGAFTIETWITTTDDTYAPLFTFGNFNPAQIASQQQAVDAPICVVGCTVPKEQVINAMARSRPTHLVFTGTTDTVRVFVNGVLAGAWLVENSANLVVDGGEFFELGSFSIGRTYGLFAVYDRALSPGEVLSHYFVGPRPEPSDATNVELLALFAAISDDGLFGLPARRRTIVDGSDGSVNGSVVAAAQQHGLYRQILDVPDSGIELYSELDFRSFGNQIESGGTLSVWRMSREWNLDAEWDTSGISPWATLGASGADDRGDRPIEEFPVETNGRAFGSVWVSDVVDAAAANPASNYGFQFTCDGCAVEVDNGPPDYRNFNRLRVKSLWERARNTSPVSPPQNAGAQWVSADRLAVEWNAQREAVEIFVNGQLVRHLVNGSQASVPVDTAREMTTLELRSSDRWGRVSETIDVTPLP